MIININNVATFVAIFDKLSDTRFTMRTPAAIVKGTDLPEDGVLAMATELGLRIVSSREDDTKKFVVMPHGFTHAQCGEMAQRGIALTGDATFECSFLPQPRPVAAEPQRDLVVSDEDDGVDLFRDIEGGLRN